MKRTITGLLLLFGTLQSAMAQTTEGKVEDQTTGNPIELASVVLLKADSTFIKGTTTDVNGNFSLITITDESKYLKISHIGYRDTIVEPDGRFLHISLLPEVSMLKEVKVEASKSYTKMLANGDIEFDPSFLADAINASDIVRNLPLVFSSGGDDLTLAGKSSVTFYINGKRQNASTSEMMKILRSYPASDIEKINIVLTPHGQYAAGGDSGAIDIILKKKPSDYLGVNAEYKHIQDNTHSDEASAGLIWRGKKFEATLNLSGSINRLDVAEHRWTAYPEFQRDEYDDITRKDKSLSTRLNLQWNLPKDWVTGITAYVIPGSQNRKDRYRYEYTHEGSELQKPEFFYGQRKDTDRTYLGQFYAVGNLSSKAMLYLYLDAYSRELPSSRSLFDIDGEQAQNHLTGGKSWQLYPQTFLVLNLPKQNQLTINMEVPRTRTSDNNEGFIGYNDIITPDQFRYTETIGRLRVLGSTPISEKVFFNGSATYEQTWTKGREHYDNSSFSNNYGWFSFSASVSLQLPGSRLSISAYDNMIRPMLTALNPHYRYLGNSTYRQGNPELKAAPHYVGSLMWQKGYFWIQPYVEWIGGRVAEVAHFTADDKVVWRSENATNSLRYAVMVYYSYSKLRWLRLSVNTSLGYYITRSRMPELLPKSEYIDFRISPRIQFLPDPAQKWIITLSGSFENGEKTVNTVLRPMYNFNASVVWRPIAPLAVTVSSHCLVASRSKGYMQSQGLRQWFNNSYQYRGIEIGVSYTWGISLGRTDTSRLDEMNQRTHEE